MGKLFIETIFNSQSREANRDFNSLLKLTEVVFKQKCFLASQLLKKNDVSSNFSSLTHRFDKDRKLFDWYPFSLSLE